MKKKPKPLFIIAVCAALTILSAAGAFATTYCKNATNPLPHDFETSMSGWTTSASSTDDWQRGAPGGGQCANLCQYAGVAYNAPDPAAAASGTAIVGTNLSGGTNGGCYTVSDTQYFTSPVFDCSNAKDDVQLRYYRWLGVENGPFEKAYVQYRINGGAWTEVWKSGLLAYADSTWSPQTIDIPAAAGSNNVQIQYGLESDGGVECGGWNIDYVELVAVDNPPGPPTSVIAGDTPADTGGSITITWTKSADDGGGSNDVASYEVWRKLGFNGTYAKINNAVIAAGTTTYIDNSANSTSAPVNGSSYYYYVKAIDAGGNTSTSGEVGDVTPVNNTALVAAPTLSSPANLSDVTTNQPTLTWNVPNDPGLNNLHFKVQIGKGDPIYDSTYEEDFYKTTYKDAANTTADWNTTDAEVRVTRTATRGALDQVQPKSAVCDVAANETNNAQTFVPSVTGQLYSVRFSMMKSSGTGSSTVTGKLEGVTASGAPNDNVIAQTTATVNNTDQFVEFIFNTYPTVQAGLSYAFVVDQPSNGWFCVDYNNYNSTVDMYVPGDRYRKLAAGAWALQGTGYDNRFETHMIQWQYTTAQQTAQSTAVATTASNLTEATLFATATLNGQTINYFLSANGGANWESVSPGVPYAFVNLGTSLKWKATLKTNDARFSPELIALKIEYGDTNSTLVKESKVSVTGFSGPPPVPCCAGQDSFTVQSGDALAPGVYYWRVAAWNGTTYGPWSNIWQFRVDKSAPDFNGITDAEDGRIGGAINLTWSPASDPSTPITYIIYRSTSASFSPSTATLLISGVSGSSYQDTGLVNNIKYYYIVRASDALNNVDANTVILGATPTNAIPSVSCVNATYPLPHDFEASAEGWTGTGDWAWGAPTGGGGGAGMQPDPSAGHSGSKVWGNNLSGNYTDTNNTVSLTSPAFDCTGITQVKVDFWRWLNVHTVYPASPSDIVYLRASNNNFTSSIVPYDTTPKYKWDPTDIAWTHVSYDVSSVADNQSSVKIRFDLTTNNDNLVDSGWNIDDINVAGVYTTAPTYAGIISVTDSQTGGALDLAWNAASANFSVNPIYYVYMSTTPGGENYAAGPNFYTTSLSYHVTGLTNGTTYYFVVRAVDNHGNIDTNTVEKSGIPTLKDTTPPVVGTVTPSNNATAAYVAGSFDLAAAVTDDKSGLAVGTCLYYCGGSTDPSCLGTWQAAANSWVGHPLSGTCTKTSIHCNDAENLTLNMRVSDMAANVGTGAAVSRVCDAAPPTVVTAAPAADSYSNSASINSGASSCTDSESGLNSTGGYDIEVCDDGTTKGSVCNSAGTWSADVWTTATSLATTGVNGHWYRFRTRCRDNVMNTSNWSYSVGEILIDTVAPTAGIVTPGNVDTGVYVSGVFTLQTSFTDNASGLQVGTGQYFCSGSAQATCNGTWQAAITNWTGNPLTGTVNQINLQCNDGDNISLNMRVSDMAGNVGTGTAVTRKCDAAPPAITSVAPAADVITNTTSVTNGAITGSDAESGIAAAGYDIQWCNAGATKTGCDSSGVWNDPTGFSATNNLTFTGASGNWYRFRGRLMDNAGNISGYTYSNGYVLVDNQAPNNPAAVSAYDSSGKAVSMTSGSNYGYSAPGGPYFEWTAPSDPGGSGVSGYYVYFGVNPLAVPSSFQTTLNYTNTTSLTPGTVYYFIVMVKDNAGNISSPATLFTYRYSTGSYFYVTENDDPAAMYGATSGSADDPDGILAPDNSDFEIVTFNIHDEWDNIYTNPPINTQTVTLTLSNIGSTGAYISETNLVGATVGPGVTSITGKLTAGQGYLKMMANGSPQSTPVQVNGSAAGLSGINGHNQVANVIIVPKTGVDINVGSVLGNIASPQPGGTVMQPTWSHGGGDLVISMIAAAPYDIWNIYKIHWNGSGWDPALRLTNNNMKVQPSARYTFDSTDTYVIYAAFDGAAHMYAVKADGSDSNKTPAQLAAAGQEISNGTSGRPWWDSQWSNTTCTNGYGDTLAVSLGDPVGGIEIYTMSGSKNAQGLYNEAGSTIKQITNVSDYSAWSFHPSWSPDCSKLVFAVWDGYAVPSRTGIYMANLTDTSYGPVVTSFPITDVITPQQGIYKILDCNHISCPNGSAMYPAFTADGTMISYMADPDNSFNMGDLIAGSFLGTNLTSTLFNNQFFGSYVVYLGYQPNFVAQMVGQGTDNEFGMVQCGGPNCPMSANGKLFAFIIQKTGTRDGKLSFLDLTNTSTIGTNGGLMFWQGTVTAVIPPGAIIQNQVKFQVTAPTAPPTMPDSQDELISTGTARDFFPDGIVFNTDIRMVFQYCDTGNTGYLDVNQDAACSGGGKTNINVEQMYVYFWCDTQTTVGCAPGTWVQLQGNVDRSSKTIMVATNHFSKYNVFALQRGAAAPATFVPLELNGLHTFPNPYVSAQGGDVTFYADGTSSYNQGGVITADIRIFDIRGSLVRNLFTVHTGTIQPSGTGLDIADWDARNNSGRQLASGVYPYVLRISDGVFNKTYTGMLSVVR